MINTRIAIVLLPLLAGTGCLHPDKRPPNPDDVIHQANERDAAQVHLDLVQNMIDKEQYFAALAHLEQIESAGETGPGVHFMKAEALRKMGRFSEAQAQYESLMGTPMEGQGHHGLGLLLARTDIDAAVAHLDQAVKSDPTNADFRNDLGYSYMLMGRLDIARLQFATAMQLKGKDARSTNNFIVLLLIQGRDADAAALASRADLSEADWRSLKQQAQSWTPRTSSAAVSG